jgi:hypothetical protein
MRRFCGHKAHKGSPCPVFGLARRLPRVWSRLRRRRPNERCPLTQRRTDNILFMVLFSLPKETSMLFRKLLHCSFCGKNQNEVSKLVAGPRVYICDECASIVSRVIDGSYDPPKPPPAKTSKLRSVLTRVVNFVRGGRSTRNYNLLWFARGAWARSLDKANALRVCFIQGALTARKGARIFVAPAPPPIAQ